MDTRSPRQAPDIPHTDSDSVMTVEEVAVNLRCSEAHVYNVINGRVAGVSPLPAIQMGRRKLVRRSTLENWKQANEKSPQDGNVQPATSERR
jgi:excisionase family DNA binding protein